MAEYREVDMVRPPCIVVVAPGIGARLHRDETVITLLVGDGTARAGEIWIERRRMLVDIVNVAAAGIRLPDFHQRIGNRTFVFIKYMTVHDDALAQWFAFVLLGEIRIALLHCVVAIDWAAQLGQR